MWEFFCPPASSLPPKQLRLSGEFCHCEEVVSGKRMFWVGERIEAIKDFLHCIEVGLNFITFHPRQKQFVHVVKDGYRAGRPLGRPNPVGFGPGSGCHLREKLKDGPARAARSC
jgi:hypothetical protein